MIVSSEMGYYRICELLINNGANVNIYNKYFDDALSVSKKYNKDIFNLLIENGANENNEY